MLKKLFGTRLKQIRKQQKMTQESLAEAVGVSTSTIQRWEYGEMAPEFDRLEILAKALNRKTEDFFKDLGV